MIGIQMLSSNLIFRKSHSSVSHTYLIAYLLNYLLTYLPTNLMTYLFTYLLIYLLNNLLTFSIQQSPSWEANSFSASQEIPHIL